jgi:hypothetical protein
VDSHQSSSTKASFSVDELSVKVGGRVKVRFDDNVWYEGTVKKILVGRDGLTAKVTIDYDDGTLEVAAVPDPDVVFGPAACSVHRSDETNINDSQKRMCTSSSQEISALTSRKPQMVPSFSNYFSPLAISQLAQIPQHRVSPTTTLPASVSSTGPTSKVLF